MNAVLKCSYWMVAPTVISLLIALTVVFGILRLSNDQPLISYSVQGAPVAPMYAPNTSGFSPYLG